MERRRRLVAQARERVYDGVAMLVRGWVMEMRMHWVLESSGRLQSAAGDAQQFLLTQVAVCDLSSPAFNSRDDFLYSVRRQAGSSDQGFDCLLQYVSGPTLLASQILSSAWTTKSQRSRATMSCKSS